VKKRWMCFEVQNEHWETGRALQLHANRLGCDFGVVDSHDSPCLRRYAAAGWYAERGEEGAIARSASERHSNEGQSWRECDGYITILLIMSVEIQVSSVYGLYEKLRPQKNALGGSSHYVHS
jgi:hypothetical protein